MRGLPVEDTQDGVSPLADVEKLVVEGRYGRADLALRRLEALIPSLAPAADTETLLLALYGRALLLRQEHATTQNVLAACDVLERAAHEREAELWVATACATRARFRVDSGDIGGATADLARADAEATTGDLTSDTGYRLLDALALVYAGLRLHDRADEVRGRIESSISERRVLDQAQHWSTWSGELAARAMEPLAGGAPDPEHALMGRAIEIAAKLDGLPDDQVPSTLRRGARGVRALSAAYRGRPSEALRLLGPDAFGTVGDLPLVERQIVSLAAMRAHALVGSLATARSLDDAATTPPSTLPNLVLEVCRTRERLWLETYAGGDVIPVLHRMTELLVKLGWRGMDLVADTARQALEHQALRTESRTDALTGVGNRRALDEELRQMLRFGPLPLSLILVDIDHFKGVNDVFTHVVGDEVLRQVAISLSVHLRTDDQLLRYGGDEFVVLLPGTGDEEAEAVAGRMRAAVSERNWDDVAEGLRVSITTGVAAVWTLSGRRPDADAESLFRRADERLLDGKRSRPEESRSHTRPVPPVAPADITVRVGPQAQPFERLDGEEIPVRDASRLNASLPVATALGAGLTDAELAEARAQDEPLTATTAGLPVGRRPIRGEAGADPRTAATDKRHEPDANDDFDDFDDRDSDEDEWDQPAPGSRQAFPGGPPVRSRTTNRAAMYPQVPDRLPRSVFDPDPDDDLDSQSPVGMSPRPSGRRDARSGEGHDEALHAGASPTPMRSRREARAANRVESDPLYVTSASRDAAEADAAAREVAKAQADDARKRAAREARARDDAAHEAEVRARAEHEKAVRDAELRERMAREKAARDAVAREKALRDAAAAERAEQERVAREAAEAELRAKVAREKAQQEQAAREAAEAAAREAAAAAAREAEARAEEERRRAAERARVERERREAEAREQELREAKARAEQARRAAEAREQERRDAEAREQAAREKAAREQAEKEQAAREAAEAAAARKAEQAREAAEAERRRAAERARVEQERHRAEQERREAEAREHERREAEAKAEQERREAKAEQARREAAARARAERELHDRQKVEQERLARERRERERQEAEAREAEQLRLEARARAEAEARTAAIERARIRAEAEAERARAADQIREEAYARAAEQARRAASGSFPLPGRTSVYEQAAHETGAVAADSNVTPISGGARQRRAPLYDASRQFDEPTPEPFHERRSHPRPGSAPRADQPSPLSPNPLSPNPLSPSQPSPVQPSHGPAGHIQPVNGHANGVNGHGVNGNGHQTNGHQTNGHQSNGYPANGHQTNGHYPDGPYGSAQKGLSQNGSGQNGGNQNGPVEPVEPEPEDIETTIIRTRREPFGPVTRSQAIIDLSARKRPRSPYSS